MKKWLAVLWMFVFAATLLGTGYLLYRFSHYLQELPELWARVPIYAWVIVLIATAAFYLCDYVRLFLLLRILNTRLDLRRGLKVVFISDFAGILTPTAELHVPAAVLALSDAGVPTEKATAAVTIKTAIGIIWVCIIAPVMLLAYRHVHVPRVLLNNMYYVVIPLGLILLFYAFSILLNARISAWARRKENQPLSCWKKALYAWLGRSVCDVSQLSTSKRIEHLLTHLFSVAYILVYCFIGYWLSRTLEIDMGPLTALSIFSTSLMVDYLAPVPGSIGVNEFITAYMIDDHLTPEALFVAIVLRICCKYAVIIPGAWVMFRIFHRRGMKALREALSSRGRELRPPPKPVG